MWVYVCVCVTLPVRAHVREREKSERREFTESVCVRVEKGKRNEEARDERETKSEKKRGMLWRMRLLRRRATCLLFGSFPETPPHSYPL